MAAPTFQDLTARIVQANSAPSTLTLDAGERYTLDATRLPAAVKGLHLVGAGATVEITDAPAVPGTVAFTDCTFEKVVFTAPAIVNPKVPIAGYGNARNAFRDCTFLDYAPSIVYQHGRGLVFERNRVVASDRPPPVMFSNVFCPLGDFSFQGNEMNFPPSAPPGQGAGGILVGASGPASAGQQFSNWHINDNRFLDADRPGYALDTIVDLEAGRASMRDIWVERNVCFNGKIDCNTGDNIWITDNRCRITRPGAGELLAQSAMFYVIATGATGIGSVHVERNVYVQEATTSPTVKAQAVLIHPQVHIAELVVKGNTFLVNGAGLPPVPAGVIGVHLKADAAPGVVIDRLEISENVFGLTSPTATPGTLIAVNHPSPQTGVGIGSLTIRDNRLLAGGTLDGCPPLSPGPKIAQYLRLGFPGHAITVADLVVTGNVAPPGSIVGKWFSSPPQGVTVQRSTFQGNQPPPNPG
jgi:hypothetical protein